MRDELIQRIMTPDPNFLKVNDPLITALKLFETEKYHHLPVVENQQLAGIFSSTDLVIFMQSNDIESMHSASVRDFMSPNTVSISIHSTLRVAAKLLCSGAFHSLPVVDDENRLLGIVTTTDLINHLLLNTPKGDGSIIPIRPEQLQSRLRILEEVRMAVESFLRTGHAEHEHRVLLEKLAKAENTDVSL